MAENIYKGMNVREKLSKARLYFLNAHIGKSGKNIKLEFSYFELDDIVPTATRIFARVGLTTETRFTSEQAEMLVYNTSIDEPPMVFTLPYREMGIIISNAGKEVTNVMQALGSSVTYLRRYLWMLVLDVTEPDSVDPNLGEESTEDNEFKEEQKAAAPAKKEAKKKAPATPADRKEAKKELTSADGESTQEQLTELKTLCKNLRNKDEKQDEFVQKIAMRTEGFTKIKASACTELVAKLKEILAEYDKTE